MEDNVLKAMRDAGKPVRPGDIAKTLGVDSKDVSKAIDTLKKAGKGTLPSAAIMNRRRLSSRAHCRPLSGASKQRIRQRRTSEIRRQTPEQRTTIRLPGIPPPIIPERDQKIGLEL